MDAPAPRQESSTRDILLCDDSLVVFQEQPPFMPRRGGTMLRPRMVGQIGQARLYCDCLHDGPHTWPAAYQVIRASNEESHADTDL